MLSPNPPNKIEKNKFYLCIKTIRMSTQYSRKVAFVRNRIYKSPIDNELKSELVDNYGVFTLDKAEGFTPEGLIDSLLLFREFVPEVGDKVKTFSVSKRKQTNKFTSFRVTDVEKERVWLTDPKNNGERFWWPIEGLEIIMHSRKQKPEPEYTQAPWALIRGKA